jgi:putative ABC transport system ATP-binding protein
MALLRAQLKARGATGILVTHSHAAAAAADRVVVLAADGLRDRALTATG